VGFGVVDRPLVGLGDRVGEVSEQPVQMGLEGLLCDFGYSAAVGFALAPLLGPLEIHLEILELDVVDGVTHVAVDQRLDGETGHLLGADDPLAG